MKKKHLRQTVLAARNRIPDDERRRKSLAVTERLWRVGAVRRARTIFVYVNFRSEVETLPFIDQALAKGVRICVPLTLAEERRLLAYRIEAARSGLRSGYKGIPEPDPARAPRCKAGDIDVVILPGCAFDASGGRLGYGGGYYDRFLEHDAPQACRVGIAFETQVVEAVPLLPHDQRLHWLVTEDRIIDARRHETQDSNL